MPSFSKLLRTSYLQCLLVFGGMLFADSLWLQQFSRIDQFAGDLVLRLHAARRPPPADLVVIDIDQKSLEDMIGIAGSWQWPRSVHGELIETIARQQPKAIVFDIMFSERDLYRNHADLYLAEAIAKHPHVYLPMVLTDTGRGSVANRDLPPALRAVATSQADPDAHSPLILPIFAPDLWRGGMINFLADRDQIGRHYPIYMEDRGWRFPSLAAAVATDAGWPLPSGDRMRLNWRQPPHHVSYSDIYLDGQRASPVRPQDEFTGKLVIIGTAAPGLKDLRPTPLGPLYPGVDMLASALSNLQQQDWLREMATPWLLLVTLSFLSCLWLAFHRGWSVWRIAACLLALSTLSLGFVWWRLERNEWWPLYSLLAWCWAYYLAGALLAYQSERQRKEQIRRMFQRFVDRRVVDDLITRGEVDQAVNAQSREITMLFSDIRGFTSLSENREPAEIVALLNRYFSTQVEIILNNGGTLDKFIGDAVMAFWGAPDNDPEHARRAVTAAIQMSEAVQAFAAELQALQTPFDIGIGLHTGPAVVGFIGSHVGAHQNINYTAIGDTVNLASRIEGQTKGVARVLISESTMRAAGSTFAYRDCGECHVKGREQAVRLYEPRNREMQV